jgi:hypothetical protein
MEESVCQELFVFVTSMWTNNKSGFVGTKTEGGILPCPSLCPQDFHPPVANGVKENRAAIFDANMARDSSCDTTSSSIKASRDGM